MKETILAKIETGEVTMKSKLYFIFKLVFLILLVIATCITTIGLVSYILFSLRVSGRFALLGFGARGLGNFFDLFPWHLLLLEIILIVILGSELKHFRFAYRHPALYILLGIMIMSIAIGVALNRLPLHDKLLQRYEQGRLPGGAQLYERIRVPSERPGIFQGIITHINNRNFTIMSPRGPQNVTLPHHAHPEHFLKVGDRVFVAGEVVNGNIHAYGIRKVE